MTAFKKIIALFLIFTLCFSLLSCNADEILKNIGEGDSGDKEENDDTSDNGGNQNENNNSNNNNGSSDNENSNIGVFKVTLDLGDGHNFVLYSENYHIETPANPEKEGFEFLYWYVEDPNLGELVWSFETFSITRDITIYAKWKPVNSDDNDDNEEPDVPSEPDVPTSPFYNIPEGGYDGSAVTIRFYHAMNATYQSVLDLYITEFNKLYPNITIEHTQVGGYDEVRDQIKTELTQDNQPHLAYCYPDHVALYKDTGKVVPLDAFINSTIEITDALGNKSILGLTEEQKADFIEAYYNEGAVFDERGTMYTLPLSKATEVLYYDKTFFEAHNLTVPTTWDEMEAVCAKIKEIDPNSIPLGYDSEANWFITMCAQYGSGYTSIDPSAHYLFNNETNKDFVERFRGWYEKGYVTTNELYGAYTFGLFKSTNGTRAYMCIGSTGGAMHLKPGAINGVYPFEVGIVPPPQIDKSNPKAISQGPSLVLFDHKNKQEVVATWLFAEFLTTNVEFQAKFAMTSGYMPVIKSVKENVLFAHFLEKAGTSNDWIQALAIKTGIEMQNYYFVSPAFNGSSKTRDLVGVLMQYCFVAPATDVRAMINEAFKAALDECVNNG